MANRHHGEGTIYKNAERGRWEGQVILDGVRRKATGRTRQEVTNKLLRLRTEHAAGEAIGDGNTRFADVAERWRERVLDGRDLAPSTRARNEWLLDLLVSELGAKRLRTLSVDDVERSLDHMAAGVHGRPLGKSTLAKGRALAVQVLDFAVARRYVANNVARLAVVTPKARPATSRRALDSVQAATLWAGLEGEWFGAMFRTQLVTGLRPGEAAGLYWDAVDLDGGRLTVRRGRQMTGGRSLVVDELKTAASYRTIGLPAIAVDVLRAQRVAVAEARLAASSWVDERLVFPSPTGRPAQPPHVRRELERICTELGLPVVRPNELRHTAATVLSDRGVPLELIADLLGHTSTRMLDATYRHRIRPSADAAVEVMGAMFGNR